MWARIYFIYGLATFIPLMLIGTPLVVLATAVGGERRGGNWAHRVLIAWAWLFSQFAFARVQREGVERLKNVSVGIFVSNHTSYYDGVAVYVGVPRNFRALGKVEMTKIPVFGRMYERVAVVVDRKDVESRKRSLQELKRRLDEGTSVLMFPEGTANTTDQPMLPFKDGAFRLALETGTPICPMVILGSKHVMPRDPLGLLRPGRVIMRFGDPIPVQAMKDVSREAIAELREKVAGAMRQLLRG